MEHKVPAYTYTGGRGGSAILALLQQDLAPFLLHKEAGDVESLYDALQWHVHYVARGGIAAFAISALDIALWDLRGKRLEKPLWQMAGGHAQAPECGCFYDEYDFIQPSPASVPARGLYSAPT